MTATTTLLMLLLLATITCLRHASSVSSAAETSASGMRHQRRQLPVRAPSQCRCIGKLGSQLQNITTMDDKVCSRLTRHLGRTKKLSDLRPVLRLNRKGVFVIVSWTPNKRTKHVRAFYITFVKKTRGQVRPRHRRCFRVAKVKNCSNTECTFQVPDRRTLRKVEVHLFSVGRSRATLRHSRAKAKKLTRTPRSKNPSVHDTSVAPCVQVSCENWKPKVSVHVHEDRVSVTYDPTLKVACDVEVSLAANYTRIKTQRVNHTVSTIRFADVAKGTYYAMVRPIHPETTCEPASMPFKVTGPPVKCFEWHPYVSAVSLPTTGQVMVTFGPPNSKAHGIEVRLQKQSSQPSLSEEVILPTDAENYTFSNVPNGTYAALVRPLGCRDCPDFENYGHDCQLWYAKSPSVEVGIPAATTAEMRTLALRQSPESRRDYKGDEEIRSAQYWNQPSLVPDHDLDGGDVSANDPSSQVPLGSFSSTVGDEGRSTDHLSIAHGPKYHLQYVQSRRNENKREHLSRTDERPIPRYSRTDCSLCLRVCNGAPPVATM